MNVTERGVSPPTITFKKGDSVTWIDQNATAHRLIISSEPTGEELQGFGTDEPISKGESYSFVFEASGTFTYDDPQNPEHTQGTIIDKYGTA